VTTNPAPVRFVPLTVPAMTALFDGDLDAGRERSGLPLTEAFVDPHAKRLWRRRIDQIAEDPSAAPWVAYAVISTQTEEVVGYAGFHGPPDDDGMVEIGYTVAPDQRRRGYAKGIVEALLRQAADSPSVTKVWATISPENVASQATIRDFGFKHIGEQMDEEDGLELIFEVSL
jgi:ribosomal-protein-alanine N-acetyltransferase